MSVKGTVTVRFDTPFIFLFSLATPAKRLYHTCKNHSAPASRMFYDLPIGQTYCLLLQQIHGVFSNHQLLVGRYDTYRNL